MSFHVDEEHVVPVLAPRRPGFDEGHDDAMIRERLQQMMQNTGTARRAARRHQDGRLVGTARRKQVAADNQESSRVVRAILDTVDEDSEIVNVGRNVGADCRRAFFITRAPRASGIARHADQLDVRQVFPQPATALRQ